jgi:hypothetical protein
MPPYFNTETGELAGGSDLFTEPELSAPTERDRQEQALREAGDRIGRGPEPKPADRDEAAPPQEGYRDRAQFGREEHERIRVAALADPTHPLNDERHPDHVATREKYLRLGMMADGKDYDNPEHNRVLGELHDGKIRELGADALSPAPRPVLPDGHEWDEGALVLGETEAHACGLPPHVVMQTTEGLARAIEAAEARGVEWTPELGEAELVRRFGREGAQRMADHARIAYETILESEHPLLVQRVKELARDYGDDPNVVAIFASLYTEITNAPMTPRLEAFLLRRSERVMRAAAKAKDEAEPMRRQEAAEGDEALAASLAATALAHRRWGRTEP